MVEEDQRILIAKLCGWTDIVRKNKGEYGGLVGINPEGRQEIVHSFCRCLNAMRRAEEDALDHGQRIDYICNLIDIVCPDTYGVNNVYSSTFAVAHASAAQRAEAFIKTFDLWE